MLLHHDELSRLRRGRMQPRRTLSLLRSSGRFRAKIIGDFAFFDARNTLTFAGVATYVVTMTNVRA